MNIHADERRIAHYDLFPGQVGQTNLYIIHPGQRTCWHRHQTQTDQFIVLRGEVLIQSFMDPASRSGYLPIGLSSLVTIPANHWHGYENIGRTPAHLLMYLSHKYDPADEEQMDETEVPW